MPVLPKRREIPSLNTTFQKELMLEYFRQCGDLLYDDNFSFMTVGYGGAADGS